MDGAHHVLFDRANRDSELIGDLLKSLAFKAAQDENRTRSFWQAQQYSDSSLKFLSGAQNSFRVDRLLAMEFCIKRDMMTCLPGFPAPYAISQDAGGRLVDIASKISDWFGAVASHYAGKYVLDEVIDIESLPDSTAKIAPQPVADRRGFRGQLRWINQSLCHARTLIHKLALAASLR